MGPTGCPETSATNYRSTLRNMPEERISISNLIYVCRSQRRDGPVQQAAHRIATEAACSVPAPRYVTLTELAACVT